MTDLNALKPKTVAVEVLITAYGVGENARKVTVEICTLSYHRWHELGAQVTDPIMPDTRFNPVTRTKEANPDDPDYRREKTLADARRNALRVTKALIDGGTDIPGADLEEQAEWAADNIDAGVMNALVVFLWRAAERGLAQIATRAESFQLLRGVSAGDSGSQGLDNDNLAGAAGLGKERVDRLDIAAESAGEGLARGAD